MSNSDDFERVSAFCSSLKSPPEKGKSRREGCWGKCSGFPFPTPSPSLPLNPIRLGLIGFLKTETTNKDEEIKQRIIIGGCKNTEIITIDVGGSDDLVVEETIRSIHDSVKSTCLAAQTKNIVRGGGNPHSLASIEIMLAADSKQGRERLGMEGFARALETIPATLAANAGKSSLDKVIELRSRLKNETTELGINFEGEISLINSVFEPTDSLTHSIILATETVIGLLRVDQLISARGD